MSTPQSKKGQDPKISVKDDQIVIDNGLKTVSPKIKATSVKATKVRDGSILEVTRKIKGY